MARARNIKPAFFQNEDLAELSPLARLFFIGLWTEANYKGCVEFRPKRLKVRILPYDDCDTEEIANSLDKSGFIAIYSVGGQRYLKIINFEKHQNPHKNERETGSEIPDVDHHQPQDVECSTLFDIPEKNGTTREQNAPDRADSPFPITDSPLPTEKRPRDSASGTRLSADWECPDDWIDDAIQIRPAWTRDHVASVADGFRDYWVGVAGAKGRKMDWRATWRNWVRTHRDTGGTTGPPRSQFMSHADQTKLAAARTIFGTEIEANHGTNNGRTIDITPAARQVGQQNISGATGQLRLAVPEPVEDWSSTG